MTATEKALSNLIALHHRERSGDETITMKEWNDAIKAGEKAMEQIKEKQDLLYGDKEEILLKVVPEKDLLQIARSKLQAGDIKTISDRSGIAYQTLYKVLSQGHKSVKQNEIITAVTNFLRERSEAVEQLRNAVN